MRRITDVEKYNIKKNSCLRDGLKTIDKGGIGFIYVTDAKNNIVGIVTDGDIRRAILQGCNLDENISKVLNTNFSFIRNSNDENKIAEIFDTSNIRHIPVLNEKKLIQIIVKSEFSIQQHTSSALKDYPVIIMAGGKGTRMKPFTHILPKPLVPFGEKSILEVIMDKYKSYGVKDFYLTVNFKKNLIKAYFEDKPEYNVQFVEEDKPLGTAGSLKLLPKQVNTPFFVSNCDIIIKADYSEIINFHKKGNYELTLIGSVQHLEVPYGVCTINDGGDLMKIKEKPAYDFLVNTGMYLLNPSVLEFIPEDTFYHITHLMEDLKKAGKKVGVFPVSEKSWIDVGQWEEYINTKFE